MKHPASVGAHCAAGCKCRLLNSRHAASSSAYVTLAALTNSSSLIDKKMLFE